jgi:hypothetical protein
MAAVKDMKGQEITVAKFLDDETVRFFFPRRTLSFQQRMVKSLTRELRRRGAKLISISLTVEGYARWQATQESPDTPELRFAFASRPPVP